MNAETRRRRIIFCHRDHRGHREKNFLFLFFSSVLSVAKYFLPWRLGVVAFILIEIYEN
jgi:hypothetical protein